MRNNANNYNDISGLDPDEDDFDQALWDKYVAAPVTNVSSEIDFEDEDNFNRDVVLKFKILDRDFCVYLQSGMENDKVDISVVSGDDPNYNPPEIILKNANFDRVFKEAKEQHYADYIYEPDYRNDDFEFELIDRDDDRDDDRDEVFELDIRIGGEKHSLEFWPLDNSGNFGRLCDKDGCCDLLTSMHPLLENPRYQAIKAYARASFGEGYRADFSEIVDEEDGETLGHWAARNNVLPADYQQWNLVYGGGATVIETALDFETLPEGFKDFGMKFKSKAGNETTVAEYVKANNIKAYEDDVAKYEEKQQRKAEKKQAKAVTT